MQKCDTYGMKICNARVRSIHFDQESFEQLISGGSTSFLHVRKHRKVSVARAPLATSWKQVSIKTTEILCEPIIASREAKQSLRKPITLSITRQHGNVACEAIKVPCEPKTASSKAMWVAKSTTFSLDSASRDAKIVSDHKTISALHRTKPRLSHEAKTKALCANSEVTAASLTSSALLGSRLATSGRTKELSAQLASPCEANSTFRRI